MSARAEKNQNPKGICGVQFTIEWAMWANVNALYSAVLMFIGGVVAATMETINFESQPVHSFGTVTRWIVMFLTAISTKLSAFSLLIFIIEYPRSKRRRNKKNVERPGQSYIAPFIHFTFIVGRNYLFRMVLYIIAIIPCIFALPTILGALCMFFACVWYFIAAINGEEWIAPSLAWGPGATSSEPKETKVGHTLPEAPSHPPPRPPPQQHHGMADPPTAPPPRPRNVQAKPV